MLQFAVRLLLALPLLSASLVQAEPTCGATNSFTGIVDSKGERIPEKASAGPSVLCYTVSKTEITFSITRKNANGVAEVIRSPNMLARKNLTKPPDGLTLEGFTVQMVDDDSGFTWMLDIGKSKDGQKYFGGVRINMLDHTYVAAVSPEAKK